MGNQNSRGQSSKHKRYYSVEYLNDMTNTNNSNTNVHQDRPVEIDNNTQSLHSQNSSLKSKQSNSSPNKKSPNIVNKPASSSNKKKLNVKNLSNPNLFLLPRIEYSLLNKKQAPLAPPLNKSARPVSLLVKADQSANSETTSATTTITESVATNKTSTSNYESIDYFSESTSTPVNSRPLKVASKPPFDMVSVQKSLDKILDFDNINKESTNEISKPCPLQSPDLSSVALNSSSVATIDDVDVQITDKAVDKDLADLDLTQMLAIIRNNGVFVKRSKTAYVRPENKVLPRQFLNKPLKPTNLLKTEGLKKTWRNKNVKKANSFLVVGDRIAGICNELEENLKPSLLKNIFNDSKRSSLKSSQNVIFDSEAKKEEKNQISSDSDYSSEAVGNRTNSTLMEFVKDETSYIEKMRKYSCSALDLSYTKINQSNASSSGVNQQNNETSFSVIPSRSLLDLKNIVEIVPKQENEKKANKSKSLLSQMRTFSTSSNVSNKNKNKNLSVNDLDVLGVEYEPNGRKNHDNRKTEKSSSSERKKTSASKSPNKFVNRLISIATAPKDANKQGVVCVKNEDGSRSSSCNNNRQHLSNQDIEIISRFPIDSKVYRHYISGGKSNKSDKLTNSVNINKMIDDEMRLKSNSNTKESRGAEYDSIDDCQSNEANSSCSSKSNYKILIYFPKISRHFTLFSRKDDLNSNLNFVNFLNKLKDIQDNENLSLKITFISNP
jgi:hypothetical protein